MRGGLIIVAVLATSCGEAGRSGPLAIDATDSTIHNAGGERTQFCAFSADPSRPVCARSDVLAELAIDEPAFTTRHLLQPGVLRKFRLSGEPTGCRIWWSGPGTVKVWQPEM